MAYKYKYTHKFYDFWEKQKKAVLCNFCKPPKPIESVRAWRKHLRTEHDMHWSKVGKYTEVRK